MAFRGANATRRPFTSRARNDENVQPADEVSLKSKTSPRMARPQTPRPQTSRLGRPRSVPVLERVTPEVPPTPKEESLPLENLAPLIDGIREALSKGDVELRSTFEHLLGDSEHIQSLIDTKVGVKKFDSINTEKKYKDYIKNLRQASAQQIARERNTLEATAMIQEVMTNHLHSKDEEFASQLNLHETAVTQLVKQNQQIQNEFEQKLNLADIIRQEIVAAAQRKENDLAQQLHSCQRELAHASDTLKQTRQELDTTREDRAGARAHLLAKTEELERVAQERNALQVELATTKEHKDTSHQEQMHAISDLKIEIGSLSKKYDDSSKELVRKDDGISENMSEIKALKKRLQEEERTRRALHNAMQELKGNIRVFCRVRPPVAGATAGIHVRDAANTISLDYGGEHYDFAHDKVFGTNAVQEHVFEEVSQLVQSALDGYKVCIFAYGQTGSGKTHTMQGGGEPSSWGLIPRALSQILTMRAEMQAQGWTWSLEASFLEVYNEAIRDLLRNDGDGQAPVHTIIHDDVWGSIVTNVTSVDVDSMDEIRSLMAVAARQRAVGNTEMNATSSRSHAIFALYLKGVNHELGVELSGALHLVDLAGSERLSKSGATGDRMKETQNINRSLSSLADVFLAKADEGRSHVPFRNSKLTHLMEPCLSGQGKTLMVVNVSPEDDHVHETLCSLRFAKQVGQCNTGKPKRAAKVTTNTSAPPSRPQTPNNSRPQTPRSRGLRA